MMTRRKFASDGKNVASLLVKENFRVAELRHEVPIIKAPQRFLADAIS